MHLYLIFIKSAFFVYDRGSIQLNGNDDLNIDILRSNRGNIILENFKVEKDFHQKIYEFINLFFTDLLNYCVKKNFVKNLLKNELNLKIKKAKIMQRPVKKYNFFRKIDDAIFIKKIFNKFYLISDKNKSDLLNFNFCRDYIEENMTDEINNNYCEACNKLNEYFELIIEFEPLSYEKIILTEFFIRCSQIIELFFTKNPNRIIFIRKTTITLKIIVEKIIYFINHLIEHRDETDFRCNIYKTVEQKYLTPHLFFNVPLNSKTIFLMTDSLVRTELFFSKNEEMAEKKILDRLKKIANSEIAIIEKRIEFFKFKITAYNLDKNIKSILKKIENLNIFTVLFKKMSEFFQNSELYYLPNFLDYFLLNDKLLIKEFEETYTECLSWINLLITITESLKESKNIDDIKNINMEDMKIKKFIISSPDLKLTNLDFLKEFTRPYFLKEINLEVFYEKFCDCYNELKKNINILKWEKISLDSLNDLIFNIKLIFQLREERKKFKLLI